MAQTVAVGGLGPGSRPSLARWLYTHGHARRGVAPFASLHDRHGGANGGRVIRLSRSGLPDALSLWVAAAMLTVGLPGAASDGIPNEGLRKGRRDRTVSDQAHGRSESLTWCG